MSLKEIWSEFCDYAETNGLGSKRTYSGRYMFGAVVDALDVSDVYATMTELGRWLESNGYADGPELSYDNMGLDFVLYPTGKEYHHETSA